MSESVQVLVILAIFLGFLVGIVALVIINPNKAEFKLKKSEECEEISITLDSEEK